MNEDQLAQLCLEWFSEIDRETTHELDIGHDDTAPEFSGLKKAIVKLNQQLPGAAIWQNVTWTAEACNA
ncbi:restriction endonuclease subunit R [Kushneria sp. EE4]